VGESGPLQDKNGREGDLKRPLRSAEPVKLRQEGG
jgi:hypothetical protein